MGNRRFSLTTVVLVIALLGALYGMGHLVNPPPPTPPEEKKDIPLTNEQKQNMAKAMKEREAEYKKHMNDTKTPPSMPALPAASNPDQVDVTGDIWHKRKMGSAGEKQAAEEYAAKKAKWDEWLKKYGKAAQPASMHAPSMPAPSESPMPAAAQK